MTAIVSVIVIGVMIAGSFGVSALARRNANRGAREILRVPVATASELVAGRRVRFVGIAHRVDRELTSLHTSTPCLAYVSESKLPIDQGGSGKPLIDKHMVTFTLATDAGAVEIVETDGFEVEGEPIFGDATAQGRFGEKTLGDLSNRDPMGFKHTERAVGIVSDRVIRDGARVTVVGTVELVDGKPRLVATEKYKILLSTVALSAS